MKIYNYSIKKYITSEKIKTNMILRIEGEIQEVDELLEKIQYIEVKEGHEINNVKRVYIEVKSPEIGIFEKTDLKELRKIINHIVCYNSIDTDYEEIIIEDINKLEISPILWSDCNGIYIDIGLDYKSSRVLDIAYIDNRKKAYLLESEENIELLKENYKKILTKLKRWSKELNIKITDLQELTV